MRQGDDSEFERRGRGSSRYGIFIAGYEVWMHTCMLLTGIFFGHSVYVYIYNILLLFLFNIYIYSTNIYTYYKEHPVYNIFDAQLYTCAMFDLHKQVNFMHARPTSFGTFFH